MIVAVVLFTTLRDTTKEEISTELTLNCSVSDKDYMISIANDGYFNCSNCDEEIHKDIKNLIDFSDLNSSSEKIEAYFSDLNGICE